MEKLLPPFHVTDEIVET